MKLTLAEIRKRVETEGDAYALLEDLRWGGAGPVCPHCGHDKAYFLTPKNGTSRITGPKKTLSQRRVWKCAKCRKQFSVLTGTIFHGTKIPIEVWLMVMVQMCSAKNGVSAREIERMHDLTPQSAWFMLHRLREAMKREPLVGMLRGTIVADETWIGGTPANRHGAKALRQPAKGTPIVPGVPRPHTDKTTVLSLIDKATREVRSTVIPDVTGHTLRKVISEQVDMAGSHLETDESNNYRQLGQEFQSHETVNHAADEYVRNGVSTNRAEGVLFPAQAVNRRDGITTSPRSTCPGTWPNSISGIRPAKCGTRSGCRK